MLLHDPTTGRSRGTFVPHPAAQVEAALARAVEAYRGWRETPLADRAAGLRAVAAGLRAEQASLADLVTAEMGKPVGEAAAEVEKCAACCMWVADHAAAVLAPEVVPTEATRSYVRYDPLGVILAVEPWNFPLWQVIRCAAPAVAAGNAVVLSHSPFVPACAEALERLFAGAGFPPGVFTNLRLSLEGVRAAVGHPAISAVALTGSDRAGSAVAAAAGAALRKTVLELGGSNAFIVLADADLPATARIAATGRCINSGQNCIAPKRFIVERAIHEAFTALLVREMAAMRVGDPSDPQTQVGPLARADLRDTLDRQVQASLAAGARLLLGGRALDRPGWFYAPTVLDGVRPGMPAFDEETFGPVAAVTAVADADEAVALANAHPLGLGASLATRDLARAERLAARLEAGSVFVNGFVKSDARLPFGGVKRSGYGRELGAAGLREWTNVKAVWVA